MINKILVLTNQITDFLSDKEGFSTKVSEHGVCVSVTQPNGDVIDYDIYEILLYTLSVRKLGSDIELNINTDANGNEIFAINHSAKLDLHAELKKINESFTNFKHDTIHSVFIGKQVSDSICPFSVLTLYKNGSWMRYDMVQAELMYAITHNLQLELDDSAFCYKKIKKITKDVKDQINELNNK